MEREPIQAMASLACRKTIVIATHRPAVIANCDRVLRLEDGALVSDSATLQVCLNTNAAPNAKRVRVRQNWHRSCDCSTANQAVNYLLAGLLLALNLLPR